MFPLEDLLNVELLIKDRQKHRTSNIFGFIAYSDKNPYVKIVIKDKDFWQSLDARTEGWILYAVKPDSQRYGGGNAIFVDDSLGLKAEDYPQLIILGIGPNQTMLQKNYPIEGNSIDNTYESIEKSIDLVTKTLEQILPRYRSSTNVHREVVKALNAEFATGRWKKVSSVFSQYAMDLFIKLF